MGTAASRQTAFWEACGYGNTIQVKKLLAEGEIDVDWRSFVVRSFFRMKILIREIHCDVVRYFKMLKCSG